MGLREALKESGWTQKRLATSLGVSTAAVNHWVQGNSPIPQGRLEEIEDLLGAAAVAQRVSYRTILDEGRTPLGYVLLWPLEGPEAWTNTLAPRSPEALERRVFLVAKECRATKQQVEDALLGRGLLQAEDLVTIGQVFGKNPVLMEEHLGHFKAEKQAVWDSLDGLEYTTFDVAIEELKQRKKEYRQQGLVPGYGDDGVMVDDGTEPDDIEWWLNGEDGPMEKQENVQDLQGRFGGQNGNV